MNQDVPVLLILADVVREFRDILILFLGAAVGFLLTRLSGWLEARRKRRQLSTALLAELRWTENTLRQIYERGAIAYEGLSHSSLDAVFRSLDLFDTQVAEHLIDFRALLDDTRAASEWYAQNHSRLVGTREQRIFEIKAKAGFALRALPALVSGLSDAGGQMPKPIDTTPLPAGQLPNLPESPFGTSVAVRTPEDPS